MCNDCGCEDAKESFIYTNSDKQRKVIVEKQILNKNNHQAEHNREYLKKSGVFSMNWISAPGSGKTALLERMIKDLPFSNSIRIIEGDQQSDNDTQRIKEAGGKAIQINTGSACHLNAEMIHQALRHLDIKGCPLLIIENVGNMVCPTAYDLGEDCKLAVISCTEGEDKPTKYPDLLLTAQILLINKIDLLPHLDFDLNKCLNLALKVNPALSVFPVSAKTGLGMREFYRWLNSQISLPAISVKH